MRHASQGERQPLRFYCIVQTFLGLLQVPVTAFCTAGGVAQWPPPVLGFGVVPLDVVILLRVSRAGQVGQREGVGPGGTRGQPGGLDGALIPSLLGHEGRAALIGAKVGVLAWAVDKG
ncbi:hypothetical protein D3C80_1601450 [compost metagenome]